ncbi:MAG TPA: TRAP transporter substrate-binding protein DctP [Beijerinckiaceae bacterium]|nr:TRAP transporter substrate-binding protein DctP [Beijerinckiaceae bacterium]
MIKTTRRAVLAGGLGAVAMPFIARAQTYKQEYKLSVVGNRPIPLSEGAFRWADLINERSQGRINVKVYPGSQLVGGDQTRELVAMRQGVIDMLVSSTINIAPQIREMNLFSLPFLMPDHRAFDALITGEVRKDLDATLASRDSVVMAWGENGFRELSNSKRPVRRPEDLRGMKIRYAAGPIFADIFNALGANPLQMSFADLQPALSTGAVDGQENPINLFLAFKMDTLAQRHLTIWNYVADAGIFHLNKGVWDSFSAQDKEIVRAAAEQAAKEQIAGSRKGLGAGGDRSSFDELKKRGVEVVELTEDEKKVFAAATKSVFDKWAQTTGPDLVKKAQEAIAKRPAA